MVISKGHTSNLQSLISISFILLLSTFLRFHLIDSQSLWNDEGNSYQMTQKSVSQILTDSAADIHPPLYYLLLSAWTRAAGTSEFALRGFSALSGLILIAVIYALGKKLFNPTAALIAAFCAAFNPALIYYSQEARMYELIALIGASTWLSALSLEQRATSRTFFVLRLTSFVIFLTLGLYTHYSFAFIIIALNFHFSLFILQSAIKNPKSLISNLQSLVLPQSLALLLYLPWLPTAVRQITTWPSAREYLSPLDSILGVLRWLTLGHTGDAALGAVALIGVVILIPFIKHTSLPIIIWLLIPSALTVIFGLFSSVFAKFLIIAVPALCLLIGSTLHGKRLTFNVLTLTPLLVGTIFSLNNLYFNPQYARADYRGLAQFINAVAREGDVVLTNSPNQIEVVSYYYQKPNVFPVARSRPLNVPEQIKELEMLTQKYKRVFVIYWGDQQADPQKVIESWLNEKTFKAYDQWYGDVRLAAYAVNQTAGMMNQKVNAGFGDRIHLNGYSLNETAFAAGDILQLTLFWEAESPISKRYKIFVHVIGNLDEPPVAQHDSEPVGGLVLTTLWKPNEVIADNHGVFLPLDLPKGEYKLALGLYEVNDGSRLTLPDGSDKLFLATIQVK